MNTKMSLLDFYITKYEFNVNDKLNKGQGMNIDGSINAEEIFRDKKEDGILVKWKQANNIIFVCPFVDKMEKCPQNTYYQKCRYIFLNSHNCLLKKPYIIINMHFFNFYLLFGHIYGKI